MLNCSGDLLTDSHVALGRELLLGLVAHFYCFNSGIYFTWFYFVFNVFFLILLFNVYAVIRLGGIRFGCEGQHKNS